MRAVGSIPVACHSLKLKELKMQISPKHQFAKFFHMPKFHDIRYSPTSRQMYNCISRNYFVVRFNTGHLNLVITAT